MISIIIKKLVPERVCNIILENVHLVKGQLLRFQLGDDGRDDFIDFMNVTLFDADFRYPNFSPYIGEDQDSSGLKEGKPADSANVR